MVQTSLPLSRNTHYGDNTLVKWSNENDEDYFLSFSTTLLATRDEGRWTLGSTQGKVVGQAQASSKAKILDPVTNIISWYRCRHHEAR